jgi:hypothetical protein
MFHVKHFPREAQSPPTTTREKPDDDAQMMRDDPDDVAQHPTMMMPDSAARGDRLAASPGFAACRARAGARSRISPRSSFMKGRASSAICSLPGISSWHYGNVRGGWNAEAGDFDGD